LTAGQLHCHSQSVEAEGCLRKIMRAPRYPLQLPLRYRPVGQADWLMGRTEDISSSGVLFRVDRLYDVNTPLEVSIVLAAAAAYPDKKPRVECEGRVVRTVPAEAPQAQPAVAVSIARYAFCHPQ